MSKSQKKLSGWKHFVAGGGAGACEILATMPLDTMKVQLQLHQGKFGGPLGVAKHIVASNGLRGLYFGMPAFLTQTSAKAAIRFTAFAQATAVMKTTLGNETVERNQMLCSLVAGLGAGAMEAAVWTTPTERLKILRQSNATAKAGQSQGLISSVRTIVQTQGVGGLWVGAVPTIIRQASSVGIRFMLYDTVKGGVGNVINYAPVVSLLSGGLVGAASVIANNPVDVIKSRVQAAGAGEVSFMSAARSVVQTSGVTGFYAGLTVRVPRVFAGQAITFAMYEQLANMLEKV